MIQFFLSVFLLAFGAYASSSTSVLPSYPENSAVRSTLDNLAPGTGTFLPQFTCTDIYEGSGLAAFSSFATSGPGIRDYCNKWVYANSRERALYCGGNHGSPHRFNDMWEYDIKSNTWIMLHKPDSGASPVHTWWGFTYDQKEEKAYWMCVASPWLTGTPPLMVFDPYAQNGWTIASQSNSLPNIRSQGSTFEYIPDKNFTIWYDKQWNGSGMLRYYAATNTWDTLLTQGFTYHQCSSCPGPEAMISYDSLENALIGFRGVNIFRYYFPDNSWQIVNNDSALNLADNRSATAYSPDHELHLIYDGKKLYEYRSRINELKRIYPPGIDSLIGMVNSFWNGNRQIMMFYHRVEKVFVLYGSNYTRMWVYKPETSTESEFTEKKSTASLDLAVSPNPFNPVTTISITSNLSTKELGDKDFSISVYSTRGEKVATIPLSSENITRNRPIYWNGSGLAAGTYFMNLKVGNRKSSTKFVLVR